MQYNDDTLEGTIPEEKEELSLIGFIVFFLCVISFHWMNWHPIWPVKVMWYGNKV